MAHSWSEYREDEKDEDRTGLVDSGTGGLANGSNIESEKPRPTFVSESSETPVSIFLVLESWKKSFLSTKGFDLPEPRGSRSVKREARSWLPPASLGAWTGGRS